MVPQHRRRLHNDIPGMIGISQCIRQICKHSQLVHEAHHHCIQSTAADSIPGAVFSETATLLGPQTCSALEEQVTELLVREGSCWASGIKGEIVNLHLQAEMVLMLWCVIKGALKEAVGLREQS